MNSFQVCTREENLLSTHLHQVKTFYKFCDIKCICCPYSLLYSRLHFMIYAVIYATRNENLSRASGYFNGRSSKVWIDQSNRENKEKSRHINKILYRLRQPVAPSPQIFFIIIENCVTITSRIPSPKLSNVVLNWVIVMNILRMFYQYFSTRFFVVLCIYFHRYANHPHCVFLSKCSKICLTVFTFLP